MATDIDLADYITNQVGVDQAPAINIAAGLARAEGRGLFLDTSYQPYILSDVDLRYVRHVDIRARLFVGPDAKVIIGDTSKARWGSRYKFGRIQHRYSDQSNVILQTVGLMGGMIQVEYCDYWQFLAVSGDDGVSSSTAYTQVFPGDVRKLEFFADDTTGGSYFPWISEMAFYGGSIRDLWMHGSGRGTVHQITFFKPCIEVAKVNIEKGVRIRILEMRGEGGTEFRFGSGASRCVIEDAYAPGGTSLRPGSVVVEDLGVDNLHISSYERNHRRLSLLALTPSTEIYDQWSPLGNLPIIPGVTGRHVSTGAGKVMFDLGIIPVRDLETHDIEGYGFYSGFNSRRFVVSSDTKSFRTEVELYDSNRNRITGTIEEIGQHVWPTGNGFHWSPARNALINSLDSDLSALAIRSELIAYIRIRVLTVDPSVTFSRLSVDTWALAGSSSTVQEIVKDNILARVNPQLALPTMGVAPVGRIVGGKFQSRAYCESVVGEGSSTTLINGTFRDVAVGDVLGVEMVTGATHWTIIVAVSGGQATPQVPLSSSPAIGGVVKTTRWRHTE